MTTQAEDYWQRKFREARERAALLKAVTVPELVDVYHSSGEDFDLGTMCFQALQRRPHEQLLVSARTEARSDSARRRGFAANLIDLATGTEADRAANIPLLMAMLDDPEAAVVAAAVAGLGGIQTAATGKEMSYRLKAMRDDPAVTGWDTPLAAVIDLDAMGRLAVHPSHEVRSSVGYAVAHCGELRATEILLTLTEDEDDVIRGMAAHLLDSRAYAGGLTAAVLNRLWELASEPSRAVRLDAVASLVSLRQPGADELLSAEIEAALAMGLAASAIQPLLWVAYERQDSLPAALLIDMEAAWNLSWRPGMVPSQVLRCFDES